ncbi:MAG: TPM domain-containing protein [Lachnospiraceae bacterium]|nr:TPM domain-containing protein [Lachnospiraceae bacterium]
MKRLFSVLLLTTFLVALCAPAGVFADQALADHPDCYVTDMADILSDDEEQQLNSELKALSDELNFDIVVVTTHDLEGKTAAEYCDDFFDYTGYGRDDVFSGICFLRYITPDGSDYMVWITTTGLGMIYFNDSDIDDQIDFIADYIIDGEYYKAFSSFAKNAANHVKDYNKKNPDEIAQYEDWKKTNGPDQDGFTRTEDYLDWKYEQQAYKEHMRYKPAWIVAAVIIGFIVGGSATASMKKQLISVSAATNAAGYVKKDSFKLTSRSDTFLYKNVSAVPIPQTSSSGGGSSHTSSHHSSSGRSHGGGGRRI